MNAAVTNLLRTTLSKTTKDNLNLQTQLKMPTDILKLEKHIKTMCEKIEKGATLVSGVTRQQSWFFYFLHLKSVFYFINLNLNLIDSVPFNPDRSQSSLSQFNSTGTSSKLDFSDGIKSNVTTPRDQQQQQQQQQQPKQKNTSENELSYDDLITPRGGVGGGRKFDMSNINQNKPSFTQYLIIL